MNNKVFNGSIPLKDNLMLKHKPELFYQWDFEKNVKLGLDVYSVTFGSNKKAWWLGECGHEWDATIAKRVERDSGCPYCAKTNSRLLRGFNDMWTTNPELASMLANPEDGYKYRQNSHKKLKWKCVDCNTPLGKRSSSDMKAYRPSCPLCGDKMPVAEKFMYFTLLDAGIDFLYDKSFSWSDGRRYDFYLPEQNIIVEVHGGQHYKESFSYYVGGRTLVEEQENDRYKYELAKSHGISDYIIIEAIQTTASHLINNVKNSTLHDIVGEINVEKIALLCSDSFIKTASDHWNSGIRSVEDISAIMKVHVGTARDYLKKATEIGWCDYSPIRTKKVFQFTLEGDYLNEFESAKEASEKTNTNRGGIQAVCAGRRKSSGGFKWSYEEGDDVACSI